MPDNVFHRGIDSYTSDLAHPIQDAECRACGAKMESKQTLGPHSFAAAMARSNRLAWEYWCPYNKRIGHRQLVELVQEHEKFVSKKLRALVMLDITEGRKIFWKRIKRTRVGGKLSQDGS